MTTSEGNQGSREPNWRLLCERLAASSKVARVVRSENLSAIAANLARWDYLKKTLIREMLDELTRFLLREGAIKLVTQDIAPADERQMTLQMIVLADGERVLEEISAACAATKEEPNGRDEQAKG